MRYTQIFIAVLTALSIGWDFFVYKKFGVEATISRVLYGWVKAYPGLGIAIGGLLGHLFYSQSGVR